jgi:hypothetical protein
MNAALDEVCGASFPEAALAALADLRRYPDAEVIRAGERTWLRWRAGNETVLRRVMTLPGVDLYVRGERHWYRYGCHLPAFDVPLEEEAQALHQVLFPSPARVLLPPNVQPRPQPVRLMRDDQVRETTGLICDLTDLVSWVDTATTAQLQAIMAARLDGLVMLLGKRLPLLARGERFWGERVLVPLGYRTEPALPESALWQALNLQEEELLVVRTCGAEVIATTVFEPLSRAGVRLAGRQKD